MYPVVKYSSLAIVTNYPSQSLLEAIASGCYIIASDTGDTNLLVKDDFGKLCDSNAKSIGDAILEYVKMDDAQHQQIVSDARDFALNHFTMEASMEYYYSIING